MARRAYNGIVRRILALIFSVSFAAAPAAAQMIRTVPILTGPVLTSAPAPALAPNSQSLSFMPLSSLPLLSPQLSSLPSSLVPAAVLAPITPSVAAALANIAAAPSVARSVPAAKVPASLETPALSALFDGSRALPAPSIEIPAPPSRENFPGIIEDLISPRRAELLSLAKEFSSAAPGDRKSVDARIQSLVDELNVLALPPQKSVHDIEVAAPDFFSDDFVSSPDYPRYRADAEARLLSGEYIPQFVYAGAATRLLQDFEEVLGQKLDPLPYRMYGLDLWDVVRRMQSLDEAALLRLFESQKVADPRRMIDRLKAVRVPDGARSLGMGPRQVVAYGALLRELAKKNGEKPSAVLKRQRPVFHINEEIADSVLKDFAANGYYGFDRSKVVFIIQPIFKGYRLDDAGVARADESPALPFGHGYAAAQLKYSDAFTVGARGEHRPLAKPFLDEMIAADAESRFVISTHRINDATKFTTGRVVDLDNLALSLRLLEEGHGVTIELVGNPNKQKGGNNIRFKGERRSFLIETSNSKGSPELTSVLDEAAKTNAPYNAFRLTSTPAAYKKLLDIGIRYNLRFKNGYFYLESVTGDLTQIPESHSVAIQKKGELIHDFKQLANLLDAIEFVTKQDSGRRGRKP
jgi:hypothetical protein